MTQNIYTYGYQNVKFYLFIGLILPVVTWPGSLHLFNFSVAVPTFFLKKKKKRKNEQTNKQSPGTDGLIFWSLLNIETLSTFMTN